MIKKIQTYKLTLNQRVNLYKRQFQQFKRYCFIALFSGVIMLMALFIFTSYLSFFYLVSFVFSYILMTLVSFVLNKKYVFKIFNPKSLSKQYKEFFIVGVVAFVLNFIALYILVDVYHIYYLLGQIIIWIIGAPWLFITHKLLVFSHV